MAFKVDIRKAFDTIDWNFLLLVLKRFGFSSLFCNWISTILHSARLSVLVNGSVVEYFACKRGVRQGDPLYPLLFCLAEEVLSRAFEIERVADSLQPTPYCRGINFPTHILYADDVFICCVGTRKIVCCVLCVFNSYVEVFGQLVNFDKRKLYTGAMTANRSLSLSWLSHLSRKASSYSFPGYYS